MDVIRDADVDLRPLLERTVGIIGYGNQGRAQALNLRDSGVAVIIGSIARRRRGAGRARRLRGLAHRRAVRRAPTSSRCSIPDEVQRDVYHARHRAAPAPPGRCSTSPTATTSTSG